MKNTVTANGTCRMKKGEIRAIGRINGKVASEEKIETKGKPVKLKLTLDNKIEYANGRDLALLTCVCVDENDREVPDAEAFVKFSANRSRLSRRNGSDISDHIPPSCPDRKKCAPENARRRFASAMTRAFLKVYAFSEKFRYGGY
ncbi:MAG: hypothetical protein L6V93_10290 [Clostridiales bacterium]|nr:MAG: hypothetical protein L6V93_10290 [Clostridiales bacterium]